MRTYDDVVVGSGAAGLTAAVLLGTAGRRVLLVEKAPKIGGSLPRFHWRGLAYDTGFHFSGGFAEDGLADEVLRVLGVRDAVETLPLTDDGANRFVFEREGREFEFPPGVARLTSRLKSYFPGEHRAIDRYVELARGVYERTTGGTLASLGRPAEFLAEDFETLGAVLDSLTGDRFLKALLSGYCMCYGSKPSEISFASHARMCWGMYESVVRIRRGGDALVHAFRRRLREVGVDVLTRRHVVGCADVRDRRAGRLVLDDGEEVAFGSCVFAIHPAAILQVLPPASLSPAFRHRVQQFGSSTAFFSLYGFLEDPAKDGPRDFSIVSLFPTTDVDAMLDPHVHGESGIVVMTAPVEAPRADVKPVCALEPCSLDEVAAWTGSATGGRPADYEEFKQARAARMVHRLEGALPEFAASLRVVRTASPLTYRDFLNSPDGSAYGVRQKMGQMNLLGRLPVRNLYAAGQSALLPGVVGAMMSSFMVVRQMLGSDVLDGLIAARVRG